MKTASELMDAGTGSIEGKSLSGRSESLWVGTTPGTDYPPMHGPISADVAVLGGGIVGLTTALFLKQAGARVTVVEAERIARGVSGHTTAKITSAHTLIYDYLTSKFGAEKARIYADANQTAVEFMAKLVEEKKIECDFQRSIACTFAQNEKEADMVLVEADAAERLGLPTHYSETLPIPVPVFGSVCFEEQAHFHPRKYLLALARMVEGDGCQIFEKTRALDVQGRSPFQVKTDRGEIKADSVVVATHFPFLNSGMYFARMYPRRSYLTAVKLRGEIPEGMYITAGDPMHTFRSYHGADGERYLLVGGEPHKTGHGGDTREHYRRIEAYARKHFDVDTIVYRWSTQDNRPLDRLPYIGKFTPFSGRLYLATGFKGWGMSFGTVSAMIISDAILDRPNPWQSLFDPNRLPSLTATRKFFNINLHVAGRFARDYLPELPSRFLTDLSRGEGGVVQVGKKRVAVYKGEDGSFHALSPYCTHMKCVVAWNRAEKSWDCPCHGSRFDAEGRVIHAPAVKDLKKEKEIPPA